jgi:hypothetical protein
LGRVHGAHEVEEVDSFGFVELQGADDSFEHVLGDTGGVAAFEAGVVLDADAGEHRDLFASEAFDAAVGPIGGQAGLLGVDLVSPRDQELADVVPGVHGVNATSRTCGEGGPASTCLNGDSLDSPTRSSMRRSAG